MLPDLITTLIGLLKASVVESLFIFASVVCGFLCVGPCFVRQYLVSFLVLQSSC